MLLFSVGETSPTATSFVKCRKICYSRMANDVQETYAKVFWALRTQLASLQAREDSESPCLYVSVRLSRNSSFSL
jgi:hypothetical protein